MTLTLAVPGLTRNRLFGRGEKLIASSALAIATILLCALTVVYFVTQSRHEKIAMQDRVEALQSLSLFIAEGSESLLTDGDLSPVRRMLMDAAHNHDLSLCQIALPDGRVIAAADPKKITCAALPAKWTGSAIAEKTEFSSGLAKLIKSINVAGRGPAQLEIVAPMATNAFDWTAMTAVAMSGTVGLGALLVVYRRLRSRIVPLALIREGLVELQNKPVDSLMLSPNLGAEAAAWNKLLGEIQELRKASVAERARDVLGGRSESRGDLEQGCDAISVGLVILDQAARIKHANGAAAALLQKKREELNGAEFTTVIDDEKARAALAAALGAQLVQRKTLEIERGEGVLRLQIRPLRRSGDTPGIVITIEDVTQQRVAEASRNSFVAHATHELRTPLTNIRLYVESAIEERDPIALGKCLNVVNHEVRRLERMVGEMLSVAEIEAGSLKLRKDDVRMDKLMEELHQDYEALATEKKIEMKFDLPPKMPVLQGDRDKLMLAIQNILGNGLKYTPNGGKVTLTLKNDAKALTIDVTDTGIGITGTEQELIFDRFYRSKDERVAKITGSGLGLALAREIARAHGGDITVRSELNQGSTFTITLPIPPQAA